MRKLFSLLKKSFILCKNNFPFLASIVFLSYFVGVVLGDIVDEFGFNLVSAFRFNLLDITLYSTLSITSRCLTILGIIAMVLAIKSLEQGKKNSIIFVFNKAIRLFLPVLVVFIIRYLIIMGGFVLFVVPGILFYIWYFFSLYAVVVHKKKKAEALALSKAAVRASIGKVICYLLLIGTMVLGVSVFFDFLIEKAISRSFLPDILEVIICGGIDSLFTMWATAFLLMFYLDLIKANPQISDCFELEGMEYEKVE